MAKRYTPADLKTIEKQFRKMIEDQENQFLVIDPSVAMRRTLINALTKAGCEDVLEAKDGVDATILLREIKRRLVVIAEMNTANMDGVTFMKRIHEDKQFAEAPVIIMSAETRKEKILNAVRSGAKAYLKKPFEPQTLVDKLADLELL